MHTATVRTLREFCGLSCQDIADRFDIALRTVQRWEAVKVTESTIRPEVRDWLLGLVDWMIDTADLIMQRIEEGGTELHELESGGIHLSRFVNAESARAADLGDIPWPVHSACQGFLLAVLRAEGFDVEVGYITPE